MPLLVMTLSRLDRAEDTSPLGPVFGKWGRRQKLKFETVRHQAGIIDVNQRPAAHGKVTLVTRVIVLAIRVLLGCGQEPSPEATSARSHKDGPRTVKGPYLLALEARLNTASAMRQEERESEASPSPYR